MSFPHPPAEKRIQRVHTVHPSLFILWVIYTDKYLPDKVLFVRVGEDLPDVTSPHPVEKRVQRARTVRQPLFLSPVFYAD